MAKSVKTLNKKTEIMLLCTSIIFLIIYVAFVLSYLLVQIFHLKESSDLWSNLFNSRLKQIEKMVDTNNPSIPFSNYLSIDIEGNILEASTDILKDIRLNKNGLFRKIYELKPGQVAVIFFPDIADGVQRVHLAKRFENKYLIYSFEPSDFFPDFSVGSTNLLLEVGGIIWYSNNPQYVGDSYKNSLFKIKDGNVYISLRNRITEMQDTNIIISQNISLEAKIFLCSILVMLIVFAVFNQLIRKIRKDFKLLKSEQINLEGYINGLSEAMSKQNETSSDVADILIPDYKHSTRYGKNTEFQFEENIKYRLLIEKFVGQIVLFIDAEKNSNKKLFHRLKQSINAISKTGELNDKYTAGHQRKVGELACAIAREMHLAHEDIENISMAAMIHDIGKIYIPSEILNKPGKISTLEFEMIKSHSRHGFDVAREIDFPEQIPNMILQHHEKIDGTGYPQGLYGKDIIIGSRILAVADVVEAMSSHRPYRQALGIDAALDEILKYKGSKYDSDVVDVCVQLFKKQQFAWKSD